MVMKKKGKPVTKSSPKKARAATDDDGEDSPKEKKPQFIASTPTGVISYPYLVEPDTDNGQFSDDKYKADLWVPKKEWAKDPATKKLKAKMLEAAQDKWGDKIKSLDDLDYVPFMDSDMVENQHERLQDCVGIRAKSKYPPLLWNHKKEELSEEEAAELKGGDVGRFSVGCATFEQTEVDRKTKKKTKIRGVNLYLMIFQLKEAGDALGGGNAEAMEALDEYEVEMEDMEESEDDEDETPKKKKKSVKGRKAKSRSDDDEDEDEDAEEDSEEDEEDEEEDDSEEDSDDEEDEDDEEEEEKPKRGKKGKGMKTKPRVNGKDDSRQSSFRY